MPEGAASAGEIARRIAARFGPVSGQRGKRNDALAIYVYLCRTRLGYTFTRIGNLYGKSRQSAWQIFQRVSCSASLTGIAADVWYDR